MNMREVTMYYAYDDTEFDDREACLAYEADILDLLKEINDAYSFFDKDMNVFIAPSLITINDWIAWFEDVINKSEFIHREANLTNDANKFVVRELGYCVSNADFFAYVGWFYWDSMECEWVKVDE